MKLIKRALPLVLALALALGCAVFADAAAAKHTEEKYLRDTLTLAGGGFGSVRTLTVAAIEAAADDPALGYENEYSMMTSGGVFSKHVFSGVRLYELLVSEGLDASLPDPTPVKFISKDGYTIPSTLGALRGGLSRYSARGGELEESGLPVIAAFASDGVPLVGPTGTESVYLRFDESMGYVEAADNVGGPLRLVMGQESADEFNAPNCSKWLAAVVVGDADGYVYSRVSDAELDDSEPDRTGDWTHQGAQADYRLRIGGTEAKANVSLSLAELEAMTEGTVREFYAASAGRNAYEGVTLPYLVSLYLADGLEAPTSVTVRAADGYTKTLDAASVMGGMDSFYQPGKHRDLLLAWAIDGSPLVPGETSPGYDGTNAFGPIRLIAENTISLWVKNVSEIIIGEATPFADVGRDNEYYDEINELYARGIMNGTGGGLFSPDLTLDRAQLVTMLWRAAGEPAAYGAPFADVAGNMWYTTAVAWAAENGIVKGYDNGLFGTNDPITTEQLAAILYRYAGSPEAPVMPLPEGVSGWAEDAAAWALEQDLLPALADGDTAPGAGATRAEAACALARMIKEG
ncbi:MAG: S-layer homology domain-containing protein [Oscillospiraceae bacterium]|nr:S-layer homology domain-containing protein [Oscillospiraceae bacterium]